MLNMIYIDIPVGTGFSYSDTQEGYYSSDILWVEHTYTFLQKVSHFCTLVSNVYDFIVPIMNVRFYTTIQPNIAVS